LRARLNPAVLPAEFHGTAVSVRLWAPDQLPAPLSGEAGGFMRTPDLMKDGWCLDDGEVRHQEAPRTFFIPDLALRKILQPGDLAKLIFQIAVQGEEHASVERMWVIIRERTPDGYIGMLNNEPGSIPENDRLWLGTEMPFDYRHIIAVEHGNEESIALARAPAPIPWDRSN
jgi:hypothetical protein